MLERLRKRHEITGRKPGPFYVRAVRGSVRRLAARTFHFWPRLGVWMVPADYNAPIPALSDVDPQRHQAASTLSGIELNLQQQCTRLRTFAAKFSHEWATLEDGPTSVPWDYYHNNPSFTRIDAEITHAFVRDLKPRRIIEVGSGMSTRILAAAGRANEAEGSACDVTVIDPYPGDVVLAGVPGVKALMRERVESQPHEMFEALDSGDILFIDSTHVLRAGGDVEFLLFDVLPRLKPGVVVHFHDIYLPYDYPPETYANHWFWTEQYALQALLTNNHGFEILWSSFAMFRAHWGELQAAIPRAQYREEGGPASFWLRIGQ